MRKFQCSNCPFLLLMSLSREFLQREAQLSSIFDAKDKTVQETVKIHESAGSADILSLRIVNPLRPFNLNLYLQVRADITTNLY